jgi:hypothetical protein
VNQLEIAYAYARANASIDPSLVVGGAKFHLNQLLLDYSRYFAVAHRMAWVEATVPLARLDGSITGTNISGSTTGAGDSSYLMGMLLKGGPALNAQQFDGYKPYTTLGLSLAMTAPTGLYSPDKILNLGSDRWSFKPEFAVTYPFGQQRWELDGHFNIYFFTDNVAYRGKEILKQQALPGLETHLSYSLTNSVWASLDTRYSFRGDTFINGYDQKDPQKNFTLGSEINISLNSRHSLVVEVARSVVHVNGPSFGGVALKYLYVWGKGIR